MPLDNKPNPPIQPDPNNPSPFPTPPAPVPAAAVEQPAEETADVAVPDHTQDDPEQ